VTTGAGSGGVAGPGSGAGSDGAVEVVDCRGLRCPLPIIALARRMPGLPVGSVLRLLADDPAAELDVPAWCRLRGQEYLGAGAAGGQARAYDIRRSV
jgi:tRNA 2-thiouridine synthesizing protein A